MLFLTLLLPLSGKAAAFAASTAGATAVRALEGHSKRIQSDEVRNKNGNEPAAPEHMWTEASARAELRELVLYMGALEIALALLVAALCGFVLALAVVAAGDPVSETTRPRLLRRARKQLYRLLPEHFRIRKQSETYDAENPSVESPGFQKSGFDL
jgi:hypothetical protein